MQKEQVLNHITKELATAEQAKQSGNKGMVRVCARRAAGVAITFWLHSNARQSWGVDAMSQLHGVSQDNTMPQAIREAAQRLTTKITEQFTSAFPEDPIQDCTTIIDYLMPR